MKKKPFITVETENLAVPEVHIDKEDVEETTDTDDTETITYDNVAVRKYIENVKINSRFSHFAYKMNRKP